jgi:hypothetical protein
MSGGVGRFATETGEAVLQITRTVKYVWFFAKFRKINGLLVRAKLLWELVKATDSRHLDRLGGEQSVFERNKRLVAFAVRRDFMKTAIQRSHGEYRADTINRVAILGKIPAAAAVTFGKDSACRFTRNKMGRGSNSGNGEEQKSYC